jgi:hypothetical protein
LLEEGRILGGKASIKQRESAYFGGFHLVERRHTSWEIRGRLAREKLLMVLHEEGAHLRRGRTIILWEAFLRGGGYYKGKAKAKQEVKGQARAKAKQRHQDKDKGKQRKKGTPRQGAPYFTRLVGRSSRNSKASESGFYCTRFTCICFLCCTFCFEAFYIYLLQTGFPHGGFFPGSC